MRLENETREEYKRRWQRENKDKVRSSRDRYLTKNREVIAKRSQEWRKNNPKKLKERKPHWHRKTLYGISESEYQSKFESQNGMCAICNHKHIIGRRTSLAVDHCHKTGRFRGLLCQACNRAIGLMKECPARLSKAIEYLGICMADDRCYDPYRD